MALAMVWASGVDHCLNEDNRRTFVDSSLHLGRRKNSDREWLRIFVLDLKVMAKTFADVLSFGRLDRC